ncbi:hypothetical protein BDP81DRAFT_395822 [Colletotrichum phormii]|uniref:Uncharacterized protein n=1 Tax=Colletotrichum phormii TaxID=359342 RepID=A0AAJ0EE34_9PEZI|nr:uncharacterized protein BDP81DRAFT_395822 [Colletotrichum phormii]KAK1635378.1 hypothetical protein BDP81DRAFT_395822 [Colletotrichum phormii]
MSDPPQKPPIVLAIRNDEPLPVIPIGSRDKPKDLRDASESAHQVELPKALTRTQPDYYTDVADHFLDTANFEELAGLELARPDPSIVFHRNESDVARSIEHSINREVALVLLGGHAKGTLTMDSTTQTYKKIIIPDPQPYEPMSITAIPDWTAACVYTSPEPGKAQVSSHLVLEYQDNGLIFGENLAFHYLLR